MKVSRIPWWLGSLLAAIAWSGPAWAGPEPRLSLPDFSALNKKASQQVSITLDSSMLIMAGKFLDSGDPQDEAVLEIIKGLTGIYVRSYSFDQDGDYRPSDLDAIKGQLASPGWNRVVQTKSRKTGANVEIYLMVADERAIGMALVAAESRQLTIVNIVGSIDLDKLHKLEGHLGIPNF
jgi:hypothetical protein